MLKSRKSSKTVGERLPGPGLINLADVVAIPFSLGFAYARQYSSGSLGFFDIPPTEKLWTLDQVKEAGSQVAFFAEYHEPVDHPEWIYLGNWKFNSVEESQSPPVYIEDKISPGIYRILENSRMRPAKKEEIEGLERHILLGPENLKKRIEKHFQKE